MRMQLGGVLIKDIGKKLVTNISEIKTKISTTTKLTLITGVLMILGIFICGKQKSDIC